MKDAKILSGRPVAESIYQALKPRISALKAQNIIPCLRVILVGNDPASQIYVRMKEKKSKELDLDGKLIELSKDCATEDVLDIIQTLNSDAAVHGILVQLPLPAHIDTRRVLSSVDPKKDVDGFHEINIGKLQTDSANTPIPCTARAVLEFFRYYKIAVAGQHVVIIGRSNIVGRPLAQLLSLKNEGGNATVSLCHSRTKNLSIISKLADIIIVAIGIPHFLKADMVREGAVLIDVGINRVALTNEELQENSAKNYKLVGDADFNELREKCSHITPVPGGVGAVTIASLMYNTVQQAKLLTSL